MCNIYIYMCTYLRGKYTGGKDGWHSIMIGDTMGEGELSLHLDTTLPVSGSHTCMCDETLGYHIDTLHVCFQYI